jgi:hypothetical protein
LKKIIFWKPLQYLAVYCLLLICCLSGLSQIPLHGDESTWIYTSKNYEPFIHFDSKNAVWNESFWTLTQPPVAAYWIGLGRTLGGYDADHLNQPFDFFLTEEENIENGAIPEDALLWWSRFPMAILTSLSFLLLFILIQVGFGQLTSIIFLIFVLFNSFLFYCLRLALGEASLFFFFCLALVFASLGFEAWKKKELYPTSWIKKNLFYFILMSICIGLSAASKINGALAVFAGILLSQWIGFSQTDKRKKRWFLWGLPITIALTAFIVFTLVNPFLYPNPPVNALKLLMFRSHEMALQQQLFPDYQISGFIQHLRIDFMSIFQNDATIKFSGSWLVNVPFFLIGIYGIWSVWKKNNSLHPAALILLVFGAALSIPSLFSPLNYPRYFLFPVFFGLVLIVLGTTTLVSFIINKWKNKRSTLQQETEEN